MKLKSFDKQLLDKLVDRIPTTIVLDTMMWIMIFAAISRHVFQDAWNYHPLGFLTLVALTACLWAFGKWEWHLEAYEFETCRFWGKFASVSLVAALCLFGATITAVRIPELLLAQGIDKMAQFTTAVVGLSICLFFGRLLFVAVRTPYPSVD